MKGAGRWRDWLFAAAVTAACVSWLAGSPPQDRSAFETVASIAFTSDAQGEALFPGVSLVPGRPVKACAQVQSSPTAGDVYLGLEGATGTLLNYLQVVVAVGTGGDLGSCGQFQGTTIYSGSLTGLEEPAANGATGVPTGWSPASEAQRSFELTVSVADTDAAESAQANGIFVWTLVGQTNAEATTTTASESTTTAPASATTTTGTTAPEAVSTASTAGAAPGRSTAPGAPSTGVPASPPPARPVAVPTTATSPASGRGAPGTAQSRTPTAPTHPGGRPYTTGSGAPTAPRPTAPRPTTGRPGTTVLTPTTVGPGRGAGRPRPKKRTAHSQRGTSSPAPTGVRNIRRVGHGAPALLTQLIATARRLASQARLPMTLFALLAGFLFVQGRLDRRDPKLALAPMVAEPSLRFDDSPRQRRRRRRRRPKRDDRGHR